MSRQGLEFPLNTVLPVLRTFCAAGLVAFAGLAAPAAWAQTRAAAATAVTPADQLEDFLHFVRIRSDEAALTTGQALLARGLSPAEFVALVEAGDARRFEETVQRALLIPGLEATAGAMTTTYERGKLDRARDPREIARNIDLLTSTDRGRLLGQQRLIQAGEYAVPQLLEAFLQRNNRARAFHAERVLVSLGRQAVAPLSTALLGLPEADQEPLAGILGQIPYRTSVPFLADLAANTTNPSVRAAAEAAVARLGGTTGDLASTYRQLAEGYYAQRSDLTSFPGEEFQLLWSFKPEAGGLIMREIRTPVFHEAMAMRLAERALQIEAASFGPTNGTLGLWVAANLSREIDTPPNYDNPAYPTSGPDARRPAMYFAVAAGPEVAQLVLARALDTRDTPLARMALAAAQDTAGRTALIQNGVGARFPLIEAITYPNRRVQYEAALAVAASQPTQTFVGSDRVVPTLASAILGARIQSAAVVTADPEAYQSTRALLQGLGYTVLPRGGTFAELSGAIAEAPSVDLIVSVGLGVDAVARLISDARAGARTAATPVLAVTSREAALAIGNRYDAEPSVMIRASGISPSEKQAAVNQLVARASGGPVTEEEAASYAQRSLAALRDLAVSNNPALPVGDAAGQLITALANASGPTRDAVADVLARIGQERAQRALMETALGSSGPERLALLAHVASSAKRFGNLLEQRHIDQALRLADSGDDAEATAAAALLGSLNLPNQQLMGLILPARPAVPARTAN